MREQEERWAELAICSAGERLRRTLGRLRHLLRPPVRGDCFALALPFAQRDLAQLAALSPEYAARLLASFERDGVLRRDRGVLLLPTSIWAEQPAR